MMTLKLFLVVLLAGSSFARPKHFLIETEDEAEDSDSDGVPSLYKRDESSTDEEEEEREKKPSLGDVNKSSMQERK